MLQKLHPRRIALRLLINAVAIVVTSFVVDGITIKDVQSGLLAAAIFGIVNASIKPVVISLTCPLYILSLGLFALVVNALMLGLTSYVAGKLSIGFEVNGIDAAVIGALVMGIVSWFVSTVIPDR